MLAIENRVYFYIHDEELFSAPLGPTPQRVLDLGTGFGAWAEDFAYENPCTDVLGVDMFNTMPVYTAPNMRFELWNNMYK